MVEPPPVLGSRRLEAGDLTLGHRGTPVAMVSAFSLQPGRVHLTCGPSGCGKTTLLFTLAGLLEPLSGEVRLDGAPFSSLPARRRDAIRAARIGLVFQNIHLIAKLSALENVLLGTFARGGRPDARKARALLALTGMEGIAAREAGSLSRGEAQRVAVARALLGEPGVILADEPTASLDAPQAWAVADMLEQVARASGAALLVATHDERLIGRFPDRVRLEPLA